MGLRILKMQSVFQHVRLILDLVKESSMPNHGYKYKYDTPYFLTLKIKYIWGCELSPMLPSYQQIPI